MNGLLLMRLKRKRDEYREDGKTGKRESEIRELLSNKISVMTEKASLWLAEDSHGGGEWVAGIMSSMPYAEPSL